MGDVNDVDPIRKADLMAWHQLIYRSSMLVFITSLIGSSWLGGMVFKSSRAASFLVLAVHLVAISGVIFLAYR
jgi:hypothetical protein